MKRILTGMVCFLVVLSISAVSLNAQQIHFKKTRVTVREAIEEIKSQTDYGFSYSHRLFDDTRMIVLPSTLMDVTDIVKLMTEGTNHTYLQQGQYIVFQPDKDKGTEQKPIHAVPAAPRTSDVYSRSNPGDFTGRRRKPLPPPVVNIVEETEVIRDDVVSANTKNYTSFYFPTGNYLLKERPGWALKMNLLYGFGTLTPNLAVEAGLGPRTSLEFSGSYHPWKLRGSLDNNKKLVHMILRPEFRYWTCERFNGHFFGVHAFYSRYNIGSFGIPLLFEKDYRYDGHAFGGGITYGYHLILNKRMAIEFNIGLGAAYLKYDKYACSACEKDSVPAGKTYFGPTRAGITFVFNIK